MRSRVGLEEGPGSKCCAWAWGGCQIGWSFVFVKLTTFAVVCSIPWRFFFSTFCFVIEWDEGAFAHWQGPPWSRWVFPWRGDGWTGWVVQNCKDKQTVGSDGLEKGLRCHLFFLIQTKQTCGDRSRWCACRLITAGRGGLKEPNAKRRELECAYPLCIISWSMNFVYVRVLGALFLAPEISNQKIENRSSPIHNIDRSWNGKPSTRPGWWDV